MKLLSSDTPKALLVSGPVLLRQYLYYRNIQLELVRKIFPAVSEDVLKRNAKKLGVGKSRHLFLDSDNDLALLFEYCLFYHYIQDKSLVERYISFHYRNFSPEEKIVGEAMKNACFAILEVKKILPDCGVIVQDLIHKKSRLLIDKNLSSTGISGLCMTTTILEFPEFTMSMGANIFLNSFLKSKYVVSNILSDSRSFPSLPKKEQALLILDLYKTYLEYS